MDITETGPRTRIEDFVMREELAIGDTHHMRKKGEPRDLRGSRRALTIASRCLVPILPRVVTPQTRQSYLDKLPQTCKDLVTSSKESTMANGRLSAKFLQKNIGMDQFESEVRCSADWARDVQ